MKPESVFRVTVLKWIKANLKNCTIHPVQQVAIRGEPDLILCLHGKFVGIELKASDGVPSKLQAHRLKEIRETGKGYAGILNPGNFENWKYELTQIDKGESHDG